MLLSVIVPVYNTAGEGKLEYCLKMKRECNIAPEDMYNPTLRQ